MTLTASLNGSTVATSRWFSRAFGETGPEIAAAADGTGSFGGITFEDPTGDLDVRGWMAANLDEDACTSAPRLHTGYIYDRRYRRGDYSLAAGREIECTLLDQNAVLSMRLIDGADGKRPIETDTARLSWILGSTYLSGLIADLGFVTPSGQNLDEADFRGQYPNDVINSCVLGRIYFAYWDQTTAACGLFFDLPDATTYTSTLTVSNVPADLSSTCFPPFQDAELTKDPSVVYSKTRLSFISGVVVRTNATTASTFFPSPLLSRGKQVDSTRIGKLSTATAQADIELGLSAAEDETLTFTVRLPAASVGLLDAGMRLGVRFSHLPGYESLTYVRVQRRTVAQAEGVADYYDVGVTASNLGLPVVGGGTPGDFPHPPPSPPGYVQSKYDVGASRSTVTLDAAPTEGNRLVVWMTQRGNPAPTVTPAGWTLHPSGALHAYGTDYCRMIYRVAGAGESATVTVRDAGTEAGTVQEITLAEFSGVTVTADADSSVNVSTSTLPGTVNAGTITPTASQSVLLVEGLCVGVSDYPSDVHSFITPGSGFTELEDHMTDQSGTGENFHPLHWFGYRLVDPTSGGYATAQTLGGGTLNYLGNAGEALAFVSLGDTNGPPIPAQWVRWAVVVMTGATGTTADPYAVGSLNLRLNGMPISTASYTETDPAAGTFTLSWTPFADDVITASYQGA